MADEPTDEGSRERGERIKRARAARGLSLAVVAERMGVSKGTAGHWETGVRTIKADDLAKLCELLNTSADYILFGRQQWPFRTIDLDAVLRLERDEIAQLEGAIKLMSAQAGLELSTAPAPRELGEGTAPVDQRGPAKYAA